MKRKPNNTGAPSDASVKRMREQQMGFGTVTPDALKLFVHELRSREIVKSTDVFLDIGAGKGNILDIVEPYFEKVWGVEMNTEWIAKTPAKWESSILWCLLEEVPFNETSLSISTTVAYMYDLCLKRLSRRATSELDDPHWSIQNTLLDGTKFPKVKYFISTYEEPRMISLHGNHWSLVYSQKLACSTDSYMFYVYERRPTITSSTTTTSPCDCARREDKIPAVVVAEIQEDFNS
jgi:hypothetical protein